MGRYFTYDSTSGQVLRKFNCSYAMISIQPLHANERLVEGDIDPATEYIIGGIEFPRPTMPCTVDKTSITADGVDTATISNIPTGAQAFIDGAVFEVVNDGELTITSELVGHTHVRLSLFPYLDWEVQVDGV